jgi:hypothetical protein
VTTNAKPADIDYGSLTVEAMNQYMNSPEFTARYKAWLTSLKRRTAFEQAELDTILQEESKAHD